ncbi:hypothetical protein [Microbulbifer rhizosphaerae]|uniref:Fibronectin type-III domain-containing protein n=1 Tax=Microbulbifer rhizosphaerae TaxID=1562603 RepID=A0A7W4WBA7_9GAMM|nr:hypothetical protein [Microbulbifer rhizosphaerae]MBB3060533.1 hypothetical protein [Microbulbifer rhizosphaerae]
MSVCRLAIVFILAVGFAVPASAQELELCSSMQPCPAPRPVTVGVESTQPIVWRGRTYFAGDIASDVGFFTLDETASGERLGAVQRPLVGRLAGSADGRLVSFTLNETVTVPAEVSQRAAALGARQLLYVRQFSINGMSVTGVQTIRLSASLPNAARSLPEGQAVTASGLIVRRVALRFDDGAAVASVGRSERLRALAAIRYDRAGLLEAVWEVATPATTRGQPVFRRLDTVRQYLGGGQEASLQSPVLPTDEAGLYLLRLRLLQPSLESDSIELRYQVSGKPAAPVFVPVLPVTSPQAGTALDAATEFRWRPAAGTRAYQLELYDQPPSAATSVTSSEPGTVPAEMTAAPATGVLLQGNTDRTRLSPTVLHRLLPGRIYYWRVSAVNAEGAIVAASPIQSIRTEE